MAIITAKCYLSSCEKGYPDLLVHYEDKDMIIELERTRKSKVAEVAKLIGKHWKEMTSEEKSKYIKIAEANKKIYESETQK